MIFYSKNFIEFLKLFLKHTKLNQQFYAVYTLLTDARKKIEAFVKLATTKTPKYVVLRCCIYPKNNTKLCVKYVFIYLSVSLALYLYLLN